MAPLLDDIEAAVMVQQGLFEAGHAFQEDAIWDRINAPKRMLIGPWGHNLVVDDHLAAYVGGNTTQQVILDWFDFWLKGIGEPPRVGVVDVQDTGGAWMELDAWPPEVTQELLYLTSDGLQPEASGGATSFIGLTFEDGAPCDLEADRADLLGARVVYASEPLSSPVSLVGNPMAYLQVTSSQAGGLLALDLYHVGPGGLCDEPVRLSWGGGDLRHLDGNGTGRPFPTGQATPVRIDLAGMAVPIPSGDRLALVASSTGAFEYRGGPYTPTLAIEGVSHIVLPLLEGSLGGHAPTMDYPPRPRMDP